MSSSCLNANRLWQTYEVHTAMPNIVPFFATNMHGPDLVAPPTGPLSCQVALGFRMGEPLIAYCAGPAHRGSQGPALVPEVQSACSS